MQKTDNTTHKYEMYNFIRNVLFIAILVLPMLASATPELPDVDPEATAPIGDYVVELFMLATTAGIYLLWRQRKAVNS